MEDDLKKLQDEQNKGTGTPEEDVIQEIQEENIPEMPEEDVLKTGGEGEQPENSDGEEPSEPQAREVTPEITDEEASEPAEEELPEITDEEPSEPADEELPEITDEEPSESAEEELPEITDEEPSGPAEEELPETTDEKPSEPAEEELPEITDEEPSEPAEEELPEITDEKTSGAGSEKQPESGNEPGNPEPTEDDDRPDPVARVLKRQRRRKVITAVLVTLVILGVLGAGGWAIYSHYAEYYSEHFYEGTTINGTDVSGRTVEEIKESIRRDVAKYQLKIEELDGETEILTSEDVGWHYVDDGKVDQLMKDQDPWYWIRHYKSDHKYSITAGTDYDREKAQKAIEALECFQEENITPPSDAKLVQKKNGKYKVKKEVQGNQLDEEKAIATIIDALDNVKTSVSLVEPDCYLHPTIFKDDPVLCSRRDSWNRFLGISIVYKFGENEEVIDKDFLLPYITDDGTRVTLNTDWIRDLVYSWGKKYDSFGLERTFVTHNNKTITIPEGGDYGWCLDIPNTIADVQSAVDNAESGERQPLWLYKAMGWDNDDLTGTYVEVSLKEQKLWCYHNYELVMETDVVTGAPTPERETLIGVYAIDAKKSPAVLGTRDVQGYSSPVSFWCPFNGGQGLHDAPWRSEFGGKIYKSNGSHGCVNIPPENMEVIYNAVEIGTAVVVY